MSIERSSTPDHIPPRALLAHRIRTPLTVIQGHTGLLRRRIDREHAAESAELERSLASIDKAVQDALAAVDDAVQEETCRQSPRWLRSPLVLMTHPHLGRSPLLRSVVGRRFRA